MNQAIEPIRLPYKVRDAFLPFHARGQRYALIVAHRRAGKTEACIAELVERALRSPIPHSRYAYIGPYAGQAIDVAWNRLKRMLGHKLLQQCRVREGEHSVTLPNTSIIKLYGADNYDALRGLGFDGIILDEVADMHPEAWPLVIRPALSDRLGWVVFIGTPKGHNFFYDQREEARNDKTGKWFYMNLPASQSGILPQSELDAARADLDEEQYAQEYECSFDAAIEGAYYRKELEEAEREGRLEEFQLTGAPVDAAFDLGIKDNTAVWFFQVVNGRIDIIDHWEKNGMSIPDIVDELKTKYRENGWRMGTWHMPHDAGNDNIAIGKSIIEQIWDMGIQPTQVPKMGVLNGIQAVRLMFPYLRFNGKACYKGVEALKAYHKKKNKKDKTFRKEPHHDWSSHTADALRYLCIAVRDYDIELSRPKPPAKAPQLITSVNRKEVDVAREGELTDEDIQFINTHMFEDAYDDF